MPIFMHNIDLNGLELLVVEDDAVSLQLLSGLLIKHGARVEPAENGNEGLLKFQEKRFLIVITDINIPGISGFEMARQIKTLDQETQIIATSANCETDSFISAIEMGFNDYFLKPLDIEKLLLAVKRCGDVIAVRQQLEDEREKFRTVVECLGEGIVIKNLDFRILYQNRAMTEMLGDRTGSACYEIFDLDEPCQDCPTIRTLQDNQTHSACRSCYVNGKTINIENSASLLRDSRGTITGTVEIIRDVSQRIKAEQTIRDMAFHDPLTGLANRRLYEDRLEQTIAKSQRYGMKFGLLYLDLDYFKAINDTYGHEVGDLVLIEAADRIKLCCKRDVDTVSRQGGDEFCIIVTDCGDKEQLRTIAKELLQQFELPFHLGDRLVEVTVSIGISMFPDDASVMKELEIASDAAMYAAKKPEGIGAVSRISGKQESPWRGKAGNSSQYRNRRHLGIGDNPWINATEYWL